MKINFVIFLSIASYGLCGELEDPNEKDVEFIDQSGGIYQIKVNENNNGGIVNIAKLSGEYGEINISYVGDISYFRLLNAQEKDGFISVNYLDYETLIDGAQCMISVSDNSSTILISLNIVNIDDENPTLSTAPCTMPENTNITIDNSTCVFRVSDPDGWLNLMNFTNFLGSNGEDSLFEFKYKEELNDNVKEANVYLVLQEGINLDYETVSFYSFHVAAKDNAGHPTIPLAEVPIIVQVEDMPDQPPVWQSLQTVATIVENHQMTIQVRAKDGDFGINNDIAYLITPEEVATVDEKGLITVNEIDREKDETVTLNITAYEVQQPDSVNSASILLIVEDEDDCLPVINQTESIKFLNISIDEGSSDIEAIIDVNDEDIGENAIYTAELTADFNDFLNAFAVIPAKGYQESQLSLSITNPKLLDYENEEWQTIQMTLHTIGTHNKTLRDSVSIRINLVDKNDEFPIFDRSEYVVNVPESVSKGEFIAYIQATDRDAEDKELPHQIVGVSANTAFEIEKFGGNVTTKIDDALDYEKQTEVIIQVTTNDKVNHVGNAQLTINVIDVNDEPPKLSVTSSIGIDENQKNGAVLDTNILASDEDTTAKLTFSIDWDQSYATKTSRRLKEDTFQSLHCINIETIPGESNHEAHAKLTIIETQIDNTPDYEVFDTLYLFVVVEDLNTEKGSNQTSTLISINIGDLNDNAPIFAENTESQQRQVTENSKEGTVVTTVLATDKDINDKIEYTIESIEDTPNWVAIDSETGTITVHLKDDEQIDCDYPNPLEWLYYTVTASDGVHNTSAEITIYIIDQNDCKPELSVDAISITEDNGLDPSTTQNNTHIITLNYTDLDRDEPFHTVLCSFWPTTSPDVINTFKVENNEIIVYLTNGGKLDRETNPKFEFDLNCYDNPTHQGSTSFTITPAPRVTITLKDVNDNIPVLKEGLRLDPISESYQKDTPVPTTIVGFDPDEGKNGKITFSIIKVDRIKSENQHEDVTDYFDIANKENGKEATLSVVKDLRDKWGVLQFTIRTVDNGDVPLSSENNIIELKVLKFNFEPPKFYFPDDATIYYLKPIQSVNAPLEMYDGTVLPNINGTDRQGDKYRIKYSIPEDSEVAHFFYIQQLSDTVGQLRLSQKVAPQTYDLVLMAAVEHEDPQLGEANYNTSCNIKIGFFDANKTDPVFSSPTDKIGFEENSLDVSYQIPQATYPDITSIVLNSYYFLRNGNNSIFHVDVSSGNVTLLTTLDYESETTYELTIQASHSHDGYTPDAVEETQLILTVDVIDVNDEPPVFEAKNYFGTLLSAGAQTVLSVHATDKDTTSQGKLTYDISSVKAEPDSLSKLLPQGDWFKISNNGDITTQFDVKDNMDGYFTLEVVVTDEPPESHQDTTTVKLYLVTAKNTVRFNFGNDVETVNSKEADIKRILKEQFKYETYLERTTQDLNSTGQSARSIASIYFLDISSNAPVDAVEIYKKVTNVDTFTTLKSELLKVGLLLLSFSSETETENLEAMLRAWLIGVSVVLGAVSLILLVAFILKTRSLNQRIEKLSSTKFGSQESGLNRAGITAPTTNKHAVEGSNPVYNNDVDTKEIDRRSVTSGDSDLIGVEDDEKFNYEQDEPSKITC